MKRALIFLLLAPTSVGFIAWLSIPSINTGFLSGLAEVCAVVLSFITLLTSAIAGFADGYFSRLLPIPLRVFVAGIVGATVSPMIVCGLALMMVRALPPQWILTPFVVGGAGVMAACSLLAHDCDQAQRSSVRPASP